MSNEVNLRFKPIANVEWGFIIVTLQLLHENENHYIDARCETNKAKVIKIEDESGCEIKGVIIHKNLKYDVGEIVENNLCKGISYFKTKEEARLYLTTLLNGVFNKYNGDGQILIQSSYKDGKREGVYKSYYPSEKGGQLYIHCFCKDGKHDGEYKQYNSDGQILFYCFYKDGKRDGEYKQYYHCANGKNLLEIHCFYKNGKLDGEYKKYCGKDLAKHCFYKDGQLDGEYKTYNMFEDKPNIIDEWCLYENGTKIKTRHLDWVWKDM